MAQLGMLLLRVVVGLIFAMHGWQKFNEFTIAGTQASFQEMGVPMADLAAPGVATLELIGGIAMVLGVLTRIFAALLICDMLGAMFIVHLSNGFFVAKNGLEFVLLLAAACLLFVLAGAGRYSVDHALFGSRSSKLSKLA
ncbi:DoxX family protein [Paeniglutamicibacter kerguelensis]|uniref:Oxidoreductase n=1 Tax=Paeniglutamicibacter kerguelensis TaxID=254788 RepID=A0ABS4XDZ8_9MICC|nr:DoxX family protein [Paeniglutamicibacter kerguelensis]MBP2386690.1 putative oxidoreductase [Paeniglutamicibacter kerguelensis]